MQEEYHDGTVSDWELLNTDPVKAMKQIETSLFKPEVKAVRISKRGNKISANEARKNRRKSAKASRRKNRGK